MSQKTVLKILLPVLFKMRPDENKMWRVTRLMPRANQGREPDKVECLKGVTGEAFWMERQYIIGVNLKYFAMISLNLEKEFQ